MVSDCGIVSALIGDGEQIAPVTAVYQKYNVLGAWTGSRMFACKGDRLPRLPRGFTWRPMTEAEIADTLPFDSWRLPRESLEQT
jgi:hypothetical protein